MRSKNSLPVIFIVVVFILFSLSCSKDNEVRSYKEEITQKGPDVEKSHSHGMDIPGATETNFTWKTPDNWTDIETESKLRLATYSVKSGEKL